MELILLMIVVSWLYKQIFSPDEAPLPDGAADVLHGGE